MTYRTSGEAFGETVASRLQASEGELVLVTREGKRALAVLAPREGPLESVTAPVPATRPSVLGIGAALGDEARCPEGTWLTEPATRPGIRAEGVFTFPIGPVRGDIMESVAFQLRVVGDEILHLDLGLSYKERGLESLLRNREVFQAAEIAERVTGTTTVAHAYAFALAVEAALKISVKEEASRLRGLLAETERVAVHLGDLALLAASTGLPVAQMELMALKERVLRANEGFSRHRYLRGMVRPGGISRPVTQEDVRPWCEAVLSTRPEAERVLSDLSHTPSFADRLVRAGTISEQTIRYVKPVGPTGRSAGLDHDVRRDHPYGPYAVRSPSRVPVRTGADAWARFEVRRDELLVSYDWLARTLSEPAPEEVAASFLHQRGPGRPDTESALRRARFAGVGRVEGPRGPIAYWVLCRWGGNLDASEVTQCSIASPSRRNWWTVPTAVANGNTMQDVPIIDASFALSVSGSDL